MFYIIFSFKVGGIFSKIGCIELEDSSTSIDQSNLDQYISKYVEKVIEKEYGVIYSNNDLYIGIINVLDDKIYMSRRSKYAYDLYICQESIELIVNGIHTGISSNSYHWVYYMKGLKKTLELENFL